MTLNSTLHTFYFDTVSYELPSMKGKWLLRLYGVLIAVLQVATGGNSLLLIVQYLVQFLSFRENTVNLLHHVFG